MDRANIATAVRILEDALSLLDNAYWEACKINHKDIFYNLISVLNEELNELAKLSIEDHYMAYEPISATFRNSQSSFKQLQTNMPHWVQRTKTAQDFEATLPTVLNLLHHNA